MLGQLVGGIAHDFNNVLHMIAGIAELIEQCAENPADVRRRARRLVEATARGSSITQRLLDFVRGRDPRTTMVDAAGLLHGLRDLLEPTLGRRIVVRVDAVAGLPPLLADREQLETVLVNLAINGRDAMPDGGTLSLSAREETLPGASGSGQGPTGYIGISVQDNSCECYGVSRLEFDRFLENGAAVTGGQTGTAESRAIASSGGSADGTRSTLRGTHQLICLTRSNDRGPVHPRSP